jgi:site-specific DNA-cytosine methylase
MKKRKKRIKQEVVQKKEKPKWYEELILDLKKIQFDTLITGYWKIGKRILEEEEIKRGEENIKKISKDTGIGERTLYDCMNFAKKFATVSQIEEFKDKSWRFITHNILPLKKKEKTTEDNINSTKLNSYDSNMFYFVKPSKLPKKPEDNLLCIDVTHGEEDIRYYYEYYPTVLHVCKFVDKNGKEFSLRKYAQIQDFPVDFKFVGTRDEIKRQIGEAVDPVMGEYIIRKHIRGKKYIELFAGCGGFSVGAHKIGKKCVWCNDFNRCSTHSFKLNFPETEVDGKDIKDINEKELHKRIGGVDFIIGGPPCQGVSVAGKRGVSFKEDTRNSLYLDFRRFLKEFKPKQFIMENVSGILNYKDEIIKDFENVGYDVNVEKIDGLEIGMKQKRIRVFFIGNIKSSKGNGGST